MDFSYTLLQTPEFSDDFHIILDEFFVHCVAEASIFYHFQMILDGSSAHSFGSMMDSSDTVLHKDSFLQDFQMMGDAFSCISFAA